MIIYCNDYRLKSYKYGWMIEKRKILGEKSKTPGKVVWLEDRPAYPASLGHGLEMICERILRDGLDCEIDGLVANLRAAVQEVRSCMQQARNAA